MKAVKITTIENILDSEEFNQMFDFEAEQKELEEAGWTMEEIRKFAKFLRNNQ